MSFSGGTGVGVPGAPGAAELAAALRRLTPQEINARRASLSASHVIRNRRHTGPSPFHRLRDCFTHERRFSVDGIDNNCIDFKFVFSFSKFLKFCIYSTK